MRALLGELAHSLGAVEPWSAETTEQAVRSFAERKGMKLGSVAQPLRAAMTGRTTSPGIFDVLAVLGRRESLARLADQAADLPEGARPAGGERPPLPRAVKPGLSA